MPPRSRRSGLGARVTRNLTVQTESPMKALGLVLLLLGILSFVVPVPHSESHGVKFGDAKISVRTEHSDRLRPRPASFSSPAEWSP